MATGFYATRDAYLDLLAWIRAMCDVFGGEFRLSPDEIIFVASHAEFTAGKESGDEKDRAFVERLLDSWEAAHAATHGQNPEGCAEFDWMVEEIKTVLAANFPVQSAEAIYDTIEAYAAAREELAVARREGFCSRTDEELMAIADRLRELLPKFHAEVMDTLAP